MNGSFDWATAEDLMTTWHILHYKRGRVNVKVYHKLIIDIIARFNYLTPNRCINLVTINLN